MKLKNFGSTVAFLLLCVSAALVVTGCDEGMNMVDPIIKDPITDPGKKNPEVTIANIATGGDTSVTISGTSTDVPAGEVVTITLGDTVTATATVDEAGAWSVTVPPSKTAQLAPGTVVVTATAQKVTAESSFEHTAPQPEPTLTVSTVTQADDGSVTVSGTSTELSAGETVTVTLGDTVTVTTTTDAIGAWSATVPAAKAAQLAAGTTAVTAATSTAQGTSSFERTVPEEVPSHGIVVSTEVEQIMLDIAIDVFGADDPNLKRKYEADKSQYGIVFEVGAEVSAAAAAFRRFVEYENKKWALAISGNFDNDELAYQYYEEAYGFSIDFAISLVHNVYLEEIPEDKKFLSTGWQVFDIGMEYLLLQLANPGATEEELEGLLRESIRAGKVSIASS